MANNYQQATVEPTIPSNLVTEEELELLQECGFDYEEYDNEFYFFTEFGVDGYDHDWSLIFQNIINKPGSTINEVVVKAAETCSKMRPGEFGGWITYITKKNIRGGSIWELEDRFRREEQQTRLSKKLDFIQSVLNVAEADNDVFLDINRSDPEGLAESKKHAKKILIAKNLVESLRE